MMSSALNATTAGPGGRSRTMVEPYDCLLETLDELRREAAVGGDGCMDMDERCDRSRSGSSTTERSSTSSISSAALTEEDDNNWRPEVHFDPQSWLDNGERLLYARFAPGAWMDSERKTWVREMVVLIGTPRRHECATSKVWKKSRAANPVEAVVVFLFSDKGRAVFRYSEPYTATVEKLLSKATTSFAEDATMEVYVAPSLKAKHRRNSWWSRRYVRVDSKSADRGRRASSSYLHYRENIDGLIIQAIRRHMGMICTHDVVGSEAGLRVAELCAGDGSLAAKLLGEFSTIASMTLLERNGALSQESRRKTGEVADGVEIHCEQIDVCSVEGQTYLATRVRPHLWIASGSVLCGQVGTFSIAQATLSAMAASLQPGGIAVITGFTQSYLHPIMINEAGFDVLQGSVGVAESQGLESCFGRFHLFVLRKRHQMDHTEGAHILREELLLGNFSGRQSSTLFVI